MGWVASVVAVLTKRVLHLRLHMHRLLLVWLLVLCLQVVLLLLSVLLSLQHGLLQLKG
jgi:hypothetical protein